MQHSLSVVVTKKRRHNIKKKNYGLFCNIQANPKFWPDLRVDAKF